MTSPVQKGGRVRVPQWIVGYALAALVVVAATVLTALHVDVPHWYEALALFAAGGSTGAVVSQRTNGENSGRDAR